jgi:uncharacterized cupredoxin-like copper-binding protein
MFTRSRTLLALFAALFLLTAACGRAPADSVGAVAPVSDQAVEVVDDHADDSDDHADEAAVIEPAGDADRVVEVELSEFAIAANSFEFTPGETVEFIITNSGVVEHEFRLSNQERVDEHVAGGHADHGEDSMTDEEMAAMDETMEDGHVDEVPHDAEEAVEEDGHVDEVPHDAEEAVEEEAHEVDDAVLVLGPGETGTLVFTFPANDHDFTAAVCLIPGHYEAGMATDLSYQA